MRRLLITALAGLGALGLLGGGAATALAASGGVSIVNDQSYSPYFVPSGASTASLTVTTSQTTPEAAATVDITWPAGELTFVGNGDTSAVCTATSTSVSCVYTDYAHGTKSDSYNFDVGSGAACPLQAQITVTTADGSDTASALEACLSVSKVATHPTATPGSSDSFTATITNSGSGYAQAVAITDTEPSGLTETSATYTPNIDPSNFTLNPGASEQVVYDVTVNKGDTLGQAQINTVAVSAANAASASAQASITPVAAATPTPTPTPTPAPATTTATSTPTTGAGMGLPIGVALALAGLALVGVGGGLRFARRRA
ncbi:MAG: hypothetical protein ACREN7_00085 [Candidatus Dormibacteria bacterium]